MTMLSVLPSLARRLGSTVLLAALSTSPIDAPGNRRVTIVTDRS
jgi:hypothetical protein